MGAFGLPFFVAERRRGRLPRESCLAPRSPLPAAGAPGPSERPSRGCRVLGARSPVLPARRARGRLPPELPLRWARRVLPDVSFFPPLMPVRRPLLPLPLSHLRPAWFGAGLPGARPEGPRAERAGAAGAMRSHHAAFGPEPLAGAPPFWPHVFPPGLGSVGARGPRASFGGGRSGAQLPGLGTCPLGVPEVCAAFAPAGCTS